MCLDSNVDKFWHKVFQIRREHVICLINFFFYNQIALSTNSNVQMDNASQLVGNVMAILTAMTEVTKPIAVSL